MCSTRLNACVPSLASIHFGLAESSDRVCDTLANSVSMTQRVVKRARFAQCENEVSEEANFVERADLVVPPTARARMVGGVGAGS